MRYIRKVFGVVAAVILAFSAHAESHECIKEKVVLYNIHSKHQRAVLQELDKFLTVTGKSDHSISGILKNHKNDAGDRSMCTSSHDACRRLVASARKSGFSSFRKVASHACSEDRIVYADGAKKKKKKTPSLTDDPYSKYITNDMKKISAHKAWSLSQGASSVAVAIIDTGVDYTHPDLPNVDYTVGRDFSGNTEGTDPMDDNGHGTHVAGTIAAMGNNKIGLAGIAWNVRIIPMKFLDANGSGTLSGAIKAIDYVTNLKLEGFNIIVANNSWGGGGYSAPLAAAIENMNNAGVVFTAAAGNEANDNDASPSYPASYSASNIVSVAAIDSSDNTLAYFSNYGESSVDIAAPGVDIASTYAGGGYAKLSGTSMATPHVTGAIALLASYDSSLNKDGLIARVLSTARYNREVTGAVAGSRMLNVYNMLQNNTSQAVAKK